MTNWPVGLLTPGGRAGLGVEVEGRFGFINPRALIAEAAEDLGQRAEHDPAARFRGQGAEGRVADAGQRAKRGHAAREPCSAGAQRHAATPARAVQLIEGGVQARQGREVEFARQVVFRVVVVEGAQIGQLKRGAQAVFPHHLAHRIEQGAGKPVGVVQTAGLGAGGGA